MKILAFTIAALSLSTNAIGGDANSFSARVERAKVVEAQPANEKYFKGEEFSAFGKKISVALKECLGKPNAVKGSLIIIADINAKGSLVNIEHEPESNTAACFHEAVRLIAAPVPPKSDYAMFPLLLEMDAQR